jgi:anti-anti-sigma factor
MSAPSQTATPAGAPALSFEGEVTIQRAGELKQALLAALAGPGDLALDLGAVTDLDSAGVQLLLLGKTLAEGRRKALRVVAVSQAARRVLDLLNVAAALELPAAADDQVNQ